LKLEGCPHLCEGSSVTGPQGSAARSGRNGAPGPGGLIHGQHQGEGATSLRRAHSRQGIQVTCLPGPDDLDEVAELSLVGTAKAAGAGYRGRGGRACSGTRLVLDL